MRGAARPSALRCVATLLWSYRSGGGLVDAGIGYRFGEGTGVLKGFAIEGSVTNLTDKGYISTIGSNGFTASGDNQTLLAGTPRQFFVSLKKGF